MKLEDLDLQNKVYLPTQELMDKVQQDLIGIYNDASRYAVDVHDTLALLSKRWYENPVETSKIWYQQSLDYGADVYAVFINDVVPKTGLAYQNMMAAADTYRIEMMDKLNYLVENPEQVTAETVEMMTRSLSVAGDVSSSLWTDLQAKSSELITLLLQQPLETMESASVEILTGLLNGYFQVVSNILQTV